MVNISFTDQELQALLTLLDISVKAGGLQVAPAAVLLQQKISTAMQQPKPVFDNEYVKELD